MPERRPAPPDRDAHPASRAWLDLHPSGREPGSIEVLQHKRRSSVYRLCGLDRPVIAKRCRLGQARLEKLVYEEVLPRVAAGGVRWIGFVEDDDPGAAESYGWVFLEETDGAPLRPDAEEHRRLLARWLAGLHTSAERLPADLVQRLPDVGPARYLGRARSTRRLIERVSCGPFAPIDAASRAVLERIAGRCGQTEASWTAVERVLARAPRTLVHGDCQPKNLRVVETARGPAVVPLDWGSSGWGFAATDLGATALPTPGHVPSPPDHDTYREAVRDVWPRLDRPVIVGLAGAGTLFLALYILDVTVPALALPDANVEKVVAKLAVYESWVGDALRAIEQAP